MAIRRQLALLFVLYVIQAVPLGLSAAVPLLLKARNVSYAELAFYSVASLPFSLKLLWAPIVDSTRLLNLGRRKSWLLPTQLLAGVMMLLAGWNGAVGSWLGEDVDHPPCVKTLTIFFFTLYILMATQDIAVDGWALEILPPSKKKHASTCNTIGQNVGFYLSNISLLTMNDPETCNRFFRREPQAYPMVTIAGFLRFWGCLMLCVTFYVAFFEPEGQRRKAAAYSDSPARVAESEIQILTNADSTSEDSHTRVLSQDNALGENALTHATDEHTSISVRDSYGLLSRLIGLRPVQVACVLLLTSRIAFAATDAAGSLKMIEAGIKKENLALLAPLIFPWGVMSSYICGRLIGRYSALQIFRIGWCLRVCMVLVWMAVFLLARDVYIPRTLEGDAALYAGAFWLIMYICVSLQLIFTELMFVAQMAFFAQVSDTAIGGSSMTFFNTMGNLGNKWPGMIALSFVDSVGVFGVDAYLVESALCVTLGLVWFWALGRRTMHLLETAPASSWALERKDKEEEVELGRAAGHHPRLEHQHQRLTRRITPSPDKFGGDDKK